MRVQLFTVISLLSLGNKIMSFWQIIGTLISVIGLMEVLPGKEVTRPDGTILGKVSDIELDLMGDKIWVIVKHQGQWNGIPGKQITSLSDRVILCEGWAPAYPERMVGTLL